VPSVARAALAVRSAVFVPPFADFFRRARKWEIRGENGLGPADSPDITLIS
jgi:hypothetical protein